MNSYDQKTFDIWENYFNRRPKITADPDLSETGKKAALEKLASETLEQFESLRREIRETTEQLQAEIDSLETQALQGAEMSAEDMARERRQVELVISQAKAARDSAALMKLAEESVNHAPAVFLLAYPEIMETADQLLPKEEGQAVNPWNPDNPWEKKQDNKERARALAKLARHYDQAAAQAKTAEQVKAAEKAEAVREERNNVYSAAALIKRFEKKIVGPAEAWTEAMSQE